MVIWGSEIPPRSWRELWLQSQQGVPTLRMMPAIQGPLYLGIKMPTLGHSLAYPKYIHTCL